MMKRNRSMPTVIADITITPIGTETATTSDYIAAAENVLKQYPQLKTELYPMSTTVEGDLDTVLEAVRDMHEAPFKLGAQRLTTSIRIDDRRDGKAETMRERVQSVQNKMNP
jgi:uncharacterized protein (TIGR00106 family)